MKKIMKNAIVVACVLVVVISCTDKKEENRTGRLIPLSDPMYDPLPSRILQMKKDSIDRAKALAELNIEKAKVKPDTSWLIKETGVPKLFEVTGYFEGGDFFGHRFYGDAFIAKVKQYLGFKNGSTQSWSSAMDKGIKKFLPTLPVNRRKDVSKCFLYNADLIGRLDSLSDKQQMRLFQILDTIVKNQNINSDWIYYEPAGSWLKEEYAILNTIWHLPKLIEVHKNRYCLGKEEDNWSTIWNTRYLNPYQYAVSVVHRRLLDIKPETAAERRAVIQKIAVLLKEAAEKVDVKN